MRAGMLRDGSCLAVVEQVPIEVAGRTVQDVIDELNRQYPGVKERLCDDRGELRRFVNVYLNDEDIRFAQGKDTPVKDGDEISIIPAIAGG